jgi:hypothetical protein
MDRERLEILLAEIKNRLLNQSYGAYRDGVEDSFEEIREALELMWNG